MPRSCPTLYAVLDVSIVPDQGVRPRRKAEPPSDGRGQIFGSACCPIFGLMRHLRGLTPVEVSLLSRGVVRSPGLGSLVAATGLTQRLLPRERRARPPAVPVAVVAPGAEKEDLAAPSAGHEAQRLDFRRADSLGCSEETQLMAKRPKKHQGKTFQQRQTERRLLDDAEDRALVEDMAAKYTCSNSVARDFVDQCDLRLAGVGFDLVCSTMALDFWASPPPAVQHLVDLLRELAEERQRHQAALISLRDRLLDITRRRDVHHHLALPIEHYRHIVRQRVLLEEPDPRPVQISAVSADR